MGEAPQGHLGVVHDLGVIVVVAATAYLLFSRLRLPVLFGYLLGGVLIGPHLFAGSLIRSEEVVRELSELGIIFLLFFLGLDFDLRRMRMFLGPALLALVLQTLATIYLAQAIAPAFGWDSTSSLFFGAILGMSSSMVTIWVLRDQRQLGETHARLVVAELVMEDVLAVVLLAILTGVAATQQLELGQVGLVVFLMTVFVVALFAVGRVMAARLLNRLRGLEGGEGVTLVSVALVLGISVLALQFDYSPALGAFLAGLIASQTRLAEVLASTTQALHDLFSAVFFVTMGMLIDPRLIVENAGWIVALGILTPVIKTAACWLGFFVGGQGGLTGFRAAVVKSQIGEFAFVIAALGEQLGVTDERLTSLTFGVAVLTIAATPMLNARAVTLHDWVVARTPRPFVMVLSLYLRLAGLVAGVLGKNLVLRLIRRPVLQISFYFFLQNAVVVSAFFLAGLARDSWETPWAGWLVWTAAGFALAPFLIAIIRNLNAISFILTEALFRSSQTQGLLPAKARYLFSVLASGLVLSVSLTIFVVVARPFLPGEAALVLFLALVAVVVVLLWRQFIRLNSHLEWMFMETFANELARTEQSQREDALERIQQRYPWPANLAVVELGERHLAVGRRIRDLDLRGQTGSTILAVERGGHRAFDPGPDLPLFPGDRLILLGTSAENEAAARVLSEATATARPAEGDEELRVVPVLISARGAVAGRTLGEAKVRQKYGVSVVGILRGNVRITSPKPQEALQNGDVAYVVGSKEQVAAFSEAAAPAGT